MEELKCITCGVNDEDFVNNNYGVDGKIYCSQCFPNPHRSWLYPLYLLYLRVKLWYLCGKNERRYKKLNSV